MAQAKKGKSTAKKKTSKKATSKKNDKPQYDGRIRDEIKALIMLAFGAFLIFALYVSAAGKLGEFIQGFLLGIMGQIAYLLPFILLTYAVLMLFKQTGIRGIRAIIIMLSLFLMLMLLNSARFLDSAGDPDPAGTFSQIFSMSGHGKSGGIIGVYLGGLLVQLIGKSGLYIFTIVALIILIILAVNTPISKYFEALNAKRLERKERKLERLEEEEQQREIDEKASQQALKIGRGQDDNIKDDIKIEGIETPPVRRESEPAPVITAPKESFVKEKMKNPFANDPNLSNGQKNIMDLAKNDELFGEQQDTDKTGFELQTDEPKEVPSLTKGTGFGLDGDPDPVFFDEASDLAGDPSISNKTKQITGVPATGFGAFSKEDDMSDYKLPPVNLLSKAAKSQKTDNAAQLKEKAGKLEKTLMEFKVDAKVLKVTVGPTVTRYEVQPSIGVKINSIKNLEQDLALNLEVKSVRVVPMSSGKVIGIEAYNENTSLVTLRDIIDSPEFRDPDSKIAFALGKNISGIRMVSDLKDMPHLLIAGTTGSGKSVCINSILLSILYRATPKEVQMILIDPKVVELKSYNGIPHLAMPVVTDADKAASALEHAVREMNHRYNRFAEENVRNIKNFNEKVRTEGRDDEVMPEIVIVIDELADLMLVASQKVQDSISRLAAMARAAGMHLIVATQQPLASILTSVIKANIPSRIAFSVSSNSASRVILDNPGAERLLGNGDMLYHPVGSREAMRIQGSFVTDSEVHKVTDYVKKQASPQYVPDILETLQTETTGKLVEEEDDLYQDAVDTVVSAKQASTSMLQRRFRIGYNRAARLMEMLEERGIVGPQDGSRPRKVLATGDVSALGAQEPAAPEYSDSEDYYDE